MRSGSARPHVRLAIGSRSVAGLSRSWSFGGSSGHGTMGRLTMPTPPHHPSQPPDLRTNPCCLLDSRIPTSASNTRMVATGVLALGLYPVPYRGKSSRRVARGIMHTNPATSTQTQAAASAALSSHARPPACVGPRLRPAGLSRYDTAPLPTRIVSLGGRLANLVEDVFNAPVFVSHTQRAFAGEGGAYIARWVWGRKRAAPTTLGFEEDRRRLLAKRWAAPPPRVSGTSTPYGKRAPTRAANPLLEEEQDEEREREARGYDAEPE
ncbi:hypothetical protein C8R47DRAFT_188189 [Mycena vitilis]|nr:hypothetical protein C8R47DRAFT_188189 [Mycena vitilis]